MSSDVGKAVEHSKPGTIPTACASQGLDRSRRNLADVKLCTIPIFRLVVFLTWASNAVCVNEGFSYLTKHAATIIVDTIGIVACAGTIRNLSSFDTKSGSAVGCKKLFRRCPWNLDQ